MTDTKKKEKKRYPRYHLRYDLLIKELDRLAKENPDNADLGMAVRKLLTE